MIKRFIAAIGVSALALLSGPGVRSMPAAETSQATAPTMMAGAEGDSGILKLLGITPSAESVDYVKNKKQFQLHTLLTEQRHPKTWNLSERIKADTLAGLAMLSSVDDDIRVKLEAMAADDDGLEQAAAAIEGAILGKRKIYVYGCGATGRLAKQTESAFWRPFWRRVKSDERVWGRIGARLSPTIEDDLIGEMTGADRALISSLEGFEDLQLIGKLQIEDRGITKGDVVICVTEGGETSSVIGTVLAAHAQWKAAPEGYDPAVSRRFLYFVYNNPDDRLLPFERSRRVIEEPGITKINLTTGPQAITGSTRMQATTIETYVVGTVLEAALHRALGRFLSAREMARIGFEPERFEIGAKLREFGRVLEAAKAALPALARLTDLETATYERGRFSTYFAGRGLITVFIDSTERSPTFRLYPLDTVREPARKCWIQVWTEARTGAEAWRTFLRRPFRGLEAGRYRGPFETKIDDPYLRRAALESLKKAGDDQQALYDFSFPERREGAADKRLPTPGDLGVMVVLSSEEEALAASLATPRNGGAPAEGSGNRGVYFRRFMDVCANQGAALGVVLVTDGEDREAAKIEEGIRTSFASAKDTPVVVTVRVPTAGDPFGLGQQMAAKMLLNTHSTAVMAKLGKVIGNTMTNVSPSNLKLIGRATFLIQSHVNDVLGRPAWAAAYGKRQPVAYAEANAVLYDAIAYLKDKPQQTGQTAEVALSIIRILESLKRGRGVTDDEALAIVKGVGLASYLK